MITNEWCFWLALGLPVGWVVACVVAAIRTAGLVSRDEEVR